MPLVLLAIWLGFGLVGFIWLTRAGWVAERSGPLAETRLRRIRLGALLTLSGVVLFGMPWLILLSVVE